MFNGVSIWNPHFPLWFLQPCPEVVHQLLLRTGYISTLQAHKKMSFSHKTQSPLLSSKRIRLRKRYLGSVSKFISFSSHRSHTIHMSSSAILRHFVLIWKGWCYRQLQLMTVAKLCVHHTCVLKEAALSPNRWREGSSHIFSASHLAVSVAAAHSSKVPVKKACWEMSYRWGSTEGGRLD